jgi:hypothetical protein
MMRRDGLRHLGVRCDREANDMAEATTPASKTDGPGLSEAIGAKKAEASSKAMGQPPHIVLRVLIGLAGLSLLVGFFLPWITQPGAAEGLPDSAYAGYNLALGAWRPFDTPGKELLWLLPALGVLLSATAFMGFRWAGQIAIGTAVAIIGFSLYVLLHMFVQHTALGLWIVAGGTFIVLLLGVIAWMVESRRKLTKPDAARAAPATGAVD